MLIVNLNRQSGELHCATPCCKMVKSLNLVVSETDVQVVNAFCSHLETERRAVGSN